jgi:hypothetical protein
LLRPILPGLRPSHSRASPYASQAATAARTVSLDYLQARRQTWIGEVDAADEREAVEKAAAEFKQYAPKLMAVRRSAARSS